MDKMVTNRLFNGFFNQKKVLITGHTGFKGSWLSILLNLSGARIYGYALEPPTVPSLYKLANIDRIIESTIADIRDYDTLNKTLSNINPDIIIHMAAQPIVRKSYLNPRETYEVNVMGTVNLLDISRNCSNLKVIINITTDKCYENNEWLWGYREIDRLGGHDPYSNSKACSELVTASFRDSFYNNDHNISIASARAGNVIGGGDWAIDRLIPDFIRSIIHNKNIEIRNPYAIRPWQHVLEPLTGYLMLAQNLYLYNQKYSSAWNFGPEDHDAKNVEWIVNKLCKLWDNKIHYIVNNSKQPHEATYLKLDCSKAKTQLMWKPKWNIDITLEKIIEWTKAYMNKEDLNEICSQQILEYFNIK